MLSLSSVSGRWVATAVISTMYQSPNEWHEVLGGVRLLLGSIVARAVSGKMTSFLPIMGSEP